ncbi:metaphase-anaphase transition (Mlo2) [Fusarium subglutinans]|uniref:Metaphase-anaphase transition (Mlo2) n=1 Tax=Gibberella subglutinans TaxID=42677 RepID=A0A8H5V8B7_GIBSU|nr:metaphase-anaphase transition (Mlo2) [Fusarium subglutinans]KAF5614251.1 metaphase-anaphase transition (Mlo2) [Fusarium subglutinans]
MSADTPSASAPAQDAPQQQSRERKESFSGKSETSETSQTAAEFIRSQEALEADAREALPYSIDTCTKILGPLRQAVFACLTCNPPPAKEGDDWTPAGVCYACSIQCHGEHTLVEIFQKRNFTCDCGTKRIPSTSPCTLRLNEATNTRGGVHSEEPDVNNKYNHNFRNRFCGCECDYDPFQQKGTMFQCLGLGTTETGGCGEDWYHPGCLVGMGPNWFEKMEKPKKAAKENADGGKLMTITEGNEEQQNSAEKPGETNGTAHPIAEEEDEEEDVPMPPGFPEEDAFEAFLCYKCVDAHPWIERYAGTSGFLPAVFVNQADSETKIEATSIEEESSATTEPAPTNEPTQESRKRKAEDDAEESAEAKRVKSESLPEDAKPAKTPSTDTLPCKLKNLPPAPLGQFSLFMTEDFREAFCRCLSCYPNLNPHPQLLEEEEVYEPPLSDGGSQAGGNGGGSHGSGSLLERGESALRNVDRVRAIEGVMAYNHLKERLKPFFQQFAESGQAIGAEDIKAYFAKLRGDEQGIQEAAAGAKDGEGGSSGDGGSRKEQSGY